MRQAVTPAQEAAEAEAWFNARKFTLHTYRVDQEYWTDLLSKRNARFRAAKYGRGDSPEAAILSAKHRYVVEQGTD